MFTVCFGFCVCLFLGGDWVWVLYLDVVRFVVGCVGWCFKGLSFWRVGWVVLGLGIW